jgi:hypothetical protein
MGQPSSTRRRLETFLLGSSVKRQSCWLQQHGWPAGRACVHGSTEEQVYLHDSCDHPYQGSTRRFAPASLRVSMSSKPVQAAHFVRRPRKRSGWCMRQSAP